MMIVLAASGLVGCAQKTESQIATLPVTSSEAPNLNLERYNVSAAGVAIDGLPSDQARFQLVDKYEPIELTPEEKKKLGVKEPEVPWLKFYRPKSKGPVASFRGGAEVSTGLECHVAETTRVTGRSVYTSRPSSIIATDSVACSVAAKGPASPRAISKSRDSKVDVGEGGVSTKSVRSSKPTD